MSMSSLNTSESSVETGEFISSYPRVVGFCVCSRLDKVFYNFLWYVSASCCLNPANISRQVYFATSTAFPFEPGTITFFQCNKW